MGILKTIELSKHPHEPQTESTHITSLKGGLVWKGGAYEEGREEYRKRRVEAWLGYDVLLCRRRHAGSISSGLREKRRLPLKQLGLLLGERKKGKEQAKHFPKFPALSGGVYK